VAENKIVILNLNVNVNLDVLNENENLMKQMYNGCERENKYEC
jgi:hypothetical protein